MPDRFNSDYASFLEQHPSFAGTAAFDILRATDYARLDAQQQVYLDYTGGSLYAEPQLRRHLELMASGVFGNPHSANPASSAMTTHVEHARQRVLAWFHADPDEYTAVFTLNASGALKLTGEAFPFTHGSRYLLTFDNHNSVNGIREFASARGAEVTYAPLLVPELRLDLPRVRALLEQRDPACNNLFAFPAQSNFSGVKHPLSLIGEAHERGWHVLLDAAAFVPTNPLDLSQVKPDFVCVSFYKVFGYPTGVGALIVRRDALHLLHRPWFAGGTVNFASVQARAHVLSSSEAAFEDGTLNYLSIPAVEFGLDHLEHAGITMLRTRLEALTGWLLERLAALRHANGRHLVRIYGPINTRDRGATVTINFYDPNGHLLDYRRVEELANVEGISLRTGCFCNPGAGELAEGLTESEMRLAYESGPDISLHRFLGLMQEMGSSKSAGAIRVSFGIASTFRDAWRFLCFAEAFRDQTRLALGTVSFDIDSCRVIRDGS